MNENNNGWQEWSRHVLAELTRLNAGQDSVREQIQDVKTKIATLSAQDYKLLESKLQDLAADLRSLERTISQPDGMLDRDKDFEARLRALETAQNTNSGKLSIIAVIATPIIAAIVSLVIGLWR